MDINKSENTVMAMTWKQDLNTLTSSNVEVTGELGHSKKKKKNL